MGLTDPAAQIPVAVGHHRAAQSRHRERLGRRRDGHHPLGCARDRQHRRERGAGVRVDEVGVDLVGHDVEVVGVGQFDDSGQHGRVGHPSGGVVGMAPQQHPGVGLAAHQRLQVVGVEVPALLGIATHEPFELAAIRGGADLQEDVVDRRGQDHAAAGLGQRGDRRGHSLQDVDTGVHEVGVEAPTVALGGPAGERRADIVFEVVVAEVAPVQRGPHGVDDRGRGPEVVLGHPRWQRLSGVLGPLGVAVAPLRDDIDARVEVAHIHRPSR